MTKQIEEFLALSNSIYFLRHAETKVDPAKPIREWNLTRAGTRATKELVKSDVFADIDAIVASSEKKAQRTAKIIAKELGIPMHDLPELDELHRDHKKPLTDEEYRNRVRQALTDWDQPVPSWESAGTCLHRMFDAIRRINIMFYDNNILAVTHGIAMTILFAHLKKLESIAFERWSQLSFLSWGLIQDNRVLIDLI